jgi:predicted HTH transcriptional regulator
MNLKKDFPHADGVTDAICSFANTRGGFYILGISDKNFQIEGVEQDPELSHIFRQKIHADPYIHFFGPNLIPLPTSNKVVPVFYIPLSNDRPHLPSRKDRRVFWKRINGGKEQITYLEILMAFQGYEERREKIKLLYVELLSNKFSLQSILDTTNSENQSTYSPSTLEYNTLNTLLSDLYSIIGKNNQLIKDLLAIRFAFNAINNESKMFFREISIPIGARDRALSV